MRYGIACRIVEVMGPLVDIVGAWFDPFIPSPIWLSAKGHTVGNEHSHDFDFRNFLRIVDHHQVDEIIDIRKLVPNPTFYGYIPIHFLRAPIAREPVQPSSHRDPILGLETKRFA